MSMVESIPEEGTPILVVDDDFGMLSSIEATLCSCGLPKPALLSDARRAASLIREHGFRVLLLDILMPGVDGMDVLDEVKAEFSDLYCIMVTAVDNVDKAVEAIQKGALDYLVKPIGRDKLRSVVRSALQLAAEGGDACANLRIDEKRRYEGMLKRSVAESDALKSENAVLLEKMKASRVLFEKVLDSIPWSILVTDAEDHRIVETNQSAEGLFQYPRQAFIGKTPDFLHVDGKALNKFETDLKTAMAENRTLELRDFNLKKSDKTIFSCNYSVFFIENDDGHPIAHGHLIRDNTEQKRLEAQTQQTHKMAAIGALACGIAHDFNNMLTPIMGYTEMVADGFPENSEVVGPLRQVLAAAGRAKELVEQILHFGRERRPEKEPLFLQHIVKETLVLLKRTLPTTAAIDMSIHNCGPVLADPAQIHQLVMNLCINAFHALADQKGRIGATMESVTVGGADTAFDPPIKPGKYVKFTVKDDGCGISTETMAKIFEPYFTTKPPDQGSGLGLSIVRGIVKNHDGFIQVNSEPGHGTAFDVYLPEIEPKKHDKPVQSAELSDPAGRGRILIVDNDPQCVQLLEKMVASSGYETTAVASSVDAFELFRLSPDSYDLVLTDLTMPHINGLELSKKITRIRPDMKVVLMTGFNNSLSEEDMAEAGIKSFIAKPASIADLRKMLKEMLTS